MKKIFFILVIFSGLMHMGCKEATAQDEQVIHVIPVAQFEVEATKEGSQLIDVRTISEYDSGHIAGAQNIVYKSAAWNNTIETLDKSKPVYVYCAKGGRSAKCAALLEEAGFEEVYDLEGGIGQWKKAGKPIE